MKKDRLYHLRQIQPITLPIASLKGVGPKRAALLSRKGLRTVLDLLFFMPIRYEDRTHIHAMDAMPDGVAAMVKGKVVFGREETFYPSRKRLFKIQVRDGASILDLLWFQYKKAHLTRLAYPNREVLAYGVIQRNRGVCQMIHPSIHVYDESTSGNAFGFYPVYSSIGGLSSHTLRSLIGRTLDLYLSSLIDPIPGEVLRVLDLPPLHEAIRSVHSPAKESSLKRLNEFDTPSHRRLLFDRFFLVMLALAFQKGHRTRRSTQRLKIPSGFMSQMEELFPFKMTPYQASAIKDILADLTSGRPMNRILMGDVGCGKTIVAAVAALLCISNHRQVALMVPTQELAHQHYEFFLGLSDKREFHTVLFTGKLKTADRRVVSDKIENGDAHLVIGTQSLLQEAIAFHDLGLVIIDEQHRFGIRERALMDKKGNDPHLLVMTATPIPRTLAITVYGDMDVSLIQGFPEGRRPVITRIAGAEKKREAFDSLMRRMAAGQQGFVICPVIEGSEDVDLKNVIEMASRLKRICEPRFQTGLIHGRLSPDERDKVMNAFRKGQIHLLIGTTVIEVGIHVPRTTVMIIEQPERFGLAQLHQLRGRIGRGTEQGICFLMVSRNLSEKAMIRLKIFAENHDGFVIAEKDLELRGQGEFFGRKQAGFGELDFDDFIRESDLLVKAKREAQRVIEYDYSLSRPENRHLKDLVESLLARPLDL